ncbi:hypothetical protein FBUS_04272 [Fasciolopsis buskii]|uniref:Uncharacterized protein n=1 Tax=Fasciolopsis buskii TaxID=27845 RepID=A0A8E0RYM6_9TREM|nr:hypothetical protein FBUS_04272 [Fasciolopsis buski]
MLNPGASNKILLTHETVKYTNMMTIRSCSPKYPYLKAKITKSLVILEYAARPFRELLTESRNLDYFTKQLIINNLALGNDEITTKEVWPFFVNLSIFCILR